MGTPNIRVELPMLTGEPLYVDATIEQRGDRIYAIVGHGYASTIAKRVLEHLSHNLVNLLAEKKENPS